MTVQQHIDALIVALPKVEDRERATLTFEHYSWGEWSSTIRNHADIDVRKDGVVVLQLSMKYCTQCNGMGFHHHAVCTRCNKTGLEP
jgi:hypothetical protein